MKIIYVYAAAMVKDMETSISFYSAVLGRAPDDRPMPSLTQWRGVSDAGIQLFEDAAKAGNSTMTLVVPSMDAALAVLHSHGITSSPVQEGDFGRVAIVADPDGNAVVLAEPPSAAG